MGVFFGCQKTLSSDPGALVCQRELGSPSLITWAKGQPTRPVRDAWRVEDRDLHSFHAQYCSDSGQPYSHFNHSPLPFQAASISQAGTKIVEGNDLYLQILVILFDPERWPLPRGIT